jgi:hypothetical protein
LLVILEELTKSLLNSFFEEASDAIFCIPMIKAALGSAAMIPPVLVPKISSKRSQSGRPTNA